MSLQRDAEGQESLHVGNAASRLTPQGPEWGELVLLSNLSPKPTSHALEYKSGQAFVFVLFLFTSTL